MFSLIFVFYFGDLWPRYTSSAWNSFLLSNSGTAELILKCQHGHSVAEHFRKYSGEFRVDAKYCHHDFGSFVHHFYE